MQNLEFTPPPAIPEPKIKNPSTGRYRLARVIRMEQEKEHKKLLSKLGFKEDPTSF